MWVIFMKISLFIAVMHLNDAAVSGYLSRPARHRPSSLDRPHQRQPQQLTGLAGMRLTGPYFDHRNPTNVTAQLGSRAFLPCTVRQRMDKAVSWVRNRDSHILTVDRYTFIADERFQCFHPEDSDTWTLQIKYVQSRDEGRYECQVSTEPKISHTVDLSVVVPVVEIVEGDRDLYVNAGSTVTITCTISRSIASPSFVFWYLDGERVLSPGSERHSVSVERTSSDTTTSTLVIKAVAGADSGNYTCGPSNLPSASVVLHVLNGEHRAAMQDGVSGGPFSAHPASWLLWTACLLLSLLPSLPSRTRRAHAPPSLSSYGAEVT